MAGVNRQRQQDSRSEKRSHRNFTKRRQKIPLDKPRTVKEKGMVKLIRLKKDQIRRFKNVIPSTFKKIPSDGSGINYVHQFNVNGKPVNITFDFKFSYGESGLRHIGLRVQNRRLDNAADWAMVMDRSGHIEIFRMDHIRDFVKSKWGSVSQKNRIQKNGYEVYPVSLDQILVAQGVKPIVCELNADSIKSALATVRQTYMPKKIIKKPAIKFNPLVKKSSKPVRARIPKGQTIDIRRTQQMKGAVRRAPTARNK